jgi:hypothetical protein
MTNTAANARPGFAHDGRGRCLPGRYVLRLADQALLGSTLLVVRMSSRLELVLQWVQHRGSAPVVVRLVRTGSAHTGRQPTNTCLLDLPAWPPRLQKAGDEGQHLVSELVLG